MSSTVETDSLSDWYNHMDSQPNYNPNNPLLPPPQYREMAQAVINNSQHILDFLLRSESCGLPCEDRRAAVHAQIDFAQKFIANFYPEP